MDFYNVLFFGRLRLRSIYNYKALHHEIHEIHTKIGNTK